MANDFRWDAKESHGPNFALGHTNSRTAGLWERLEGQIIVEREDVVVKDAWLGAPPQIPWSLEISWSTFGCATIESHVSMIRGTENPQCQCGQFTPRAQC